MRTLLYILAVYFFACFWLREWRLKNTPRHPVFNRPDVNVAAMVEYAVLGVVCLLAAIFG